jgi:hypothetical protein
MAKVNFWNQEQLNIFMRWKNTFFYENEFNFIQIIKKVKMD